MALILLIMESYTAVLFANIDSIVVNIWRHSGNGDELDVEQHHDHIM